MGKFVQRVHKLVDMGFTDEEIAIQMYCTSNAIRKTAKENNFFDELEVEDSDE